MFTSRQSGLETDRLNAIKDLVRGVDVASTDAGMIDQIRGLEEVTAAAAAKMMVVTAAFAVSQRAAQAAAGVPKNRVGRGVAAQVGLARRMSPHQANRYVGQASILTRELPACFAQLVAGVAPVEDGGPTSIANGQRLCEACNYAKQPPGWHQQPTPDRTGHITTITPTGHHYRSQPPDPPGATPRTNPEQPSLDQARPAA